MERIWKLINDFFVANAPEVAGCLNGPADNSAIVELEDTLNVILPEDFKESLKVHNGECEDEGWIFSNWSLLSVANIRIVYEREKSKVQNVNIESDEFTLPVLWDEKWVPFAYDGSGGYLIIDLSDYEGSTLGQVVMTTHDGPNRKVADNFKIFIEKYYNALIEGVFEIDEGELEVKTGFSEWWSENGDKFI